MGEAERRLRVQRAVANLVTDEMLTTPVGLLTDAQVAILQAALGGPFGHEITARMDARAAAKNRASAPLDTGDEGQDG